MKINEPSELEIGCNTILARGPKGQKSHWFKHDQGGAYSGKNEIEFK